MQGDVHCTRCLCKKITPYFPSSEVAHSGDEAESCIIFPLLSPAHFDPLNLSTHLPPYKIEDEPWFTLKSELRPRQGTSHCGIAIN